MVHIWERTRHVTELQRNKILNGAIVNKQDVKMTEQSTSMTSAVKEVQLLLSKNRSRTSVLKEQKCEEQNYDFWWCWRLLLFTDGRRTLLEVGRAVCTARNHSMTPHIPWMENELWAIKQTVRLQDHAANCPAILVFVKFSATKRKKISLAVMINKYHGIFFIFFPSCDKSGQRQNGLKNAAMPTAMHEI